MSAIKLRINKTVNDNWDIDKYSKPLNSLNEQKDTIIILNAINGNSIKFTVEKYANKIKDILGDNYGNDATASMLENATIELAKKYKII